MYICNAKKSWFLTDDEWIVFTEEYTMNSIFTLLLHFSLSIIIIIINRLSYIFTLCMTIMMNIEQVDEFIRMHTIFKACILFMRK